MIPRLHLYSIYLVKLVMLLRQKLNIGTSYIQLHVHKSHYNNSTLQNIKLTNSWKSHFKELWPKIYCMVHYFTPLSKIVHVLRNIWNWNVGKHGKSGKGGSKKIEHMLVPDETEPGVLVNVPCRHATSLRTCSIETSWNSPKVSSWCNILPI